MAETIEESYETEVRRKVVRRSLKIQEVSGNSYSLPVTEHVPVVNARCAFPVPFQVQLNNRKLRNTLRNFCGRELETSPVLMTVPAKIERVVCPVRTFCWTAEKIPTYRNPFFKMSLLDTFRLGRRVELHESVKLAFAHAIWNYNITLLFKRPVVKVFNPKRGSNNQLLLKFSWD